MRGCNIHPLIYRHLPIHTSSPTPPWQTPPFSPSPPNKPHSLFIIHLNSFLSLSLLRQRLLAPLTWDSANLRSPLAYPTVALFACFRFRFSFNSLRLRAVHSLLTAVQAHTRFFVVFLPGSSQLRSPFHSFVCLDRSPLTRLCFTRIPLPSRRPVSKGTSLKVEGVETVSQHPLNSLSIPSETIDPFESLLYAHT